MKLKKILCGWLVASLMLPVLPAFAVASGGVPPFTPSLERDPVACDMAFTGKQATRRSVKSSDVMAMQTVFTAPVDSLQIRLPAFGGRNGTACVAVFRFDTDYELSLIQTPVLEHTFTGVADKTVLVLRFPESSPLPAGEYITVLYDMQDAGLSGGDRPYAGVFAYGAFEGQRAYVNGEADTTVSFDLAVTYRGKPEKGYGIPTGPKEEDEMDYAPHMEGLMDFRTEKTASALIDGTNQLQVSHNGKDHCAHFAVPDHANDPYVFVRFPENALIKCADYPFLLLKLRRPAGSPKDGQIFFITDEVGIQEPASFFPTYRDTDDWQYLIVNLGSNPHYHGLLKTLRFDVFRSCEKKSFLEIQYAALFRTEEAAKAFHDNFDDFQKPEPPEKPQEEKPDYSTYIGADEPGVPVPGRLTPNGQLNYLYREYPYTMNFDQTPEFYMGEGHFGFAQIDSALVVDGRLHCKGLESYAFFTEKILGDRYGLREGKLEMDLVLQSGSVSFTLRQIFPNDEATRSGIVFTLDSDGTVTVTERDGFRQTWKTDVDFTKEHRVAACDDGKTLRLEVDGQPVVTVLTDPISRTVSLPGSDTAYPAPHLPGAGYATFRAWRMRGYVDRVTYTFIDVVPKKAQAQQGMDYSNWTATDDLGRTVPMGLAGAGNDKKVGLFYFLIHSADMGSRYVNDVTRFYTELGMEGLQNKLSSFAGRNGCYWAEPYFGYYSSHDEWVYRKHAHMLDAAGVDFIFLDVSNEVFFLDEATLLLDTWKDIRDHGGHTPQVCFMFGDMPFTLLKGVYTLTDPIFRNPDYEDLLFRWEGKPLLLGNDDTPDGDSWTVSGTTPQSKADYRKRLRDDPALKTFYDKRYRKVLSLFTVRKCWAWQANTHTGYWDWLQESPQAVGTDRNGHVREQMSVSMGVHAHTNRGRSYLNGDNTYNQKGEFGFTLGTARYGRFFEEQCEYALKQDVQVLMITGWNEWYAGVQKSDNPNMICGQTKTPGYYMVDQMSPEYSRDGEPMRLRDGIGFGDNYYYQMVSYIRRFKGIAPETPTPMPTETVNGGALSASPSDWEKVAPVFTDTVGDTDFRAARSFTSEFFYVNGTARNDLASAKISQDADSVCFYITTGTPLITVDDENWMNLYVDADADPKTGWEGFDYVINRSRTDKTVSVERFIHNEWKTELVGEADYTVGESSLMIRVGKSLLGGKSGEILSFRFKWADNASVNGDVLRFMECGDTAPNDRFVFAYTGNSLTDDRDKPSESGSESESETAEPSGSASDTEPVVTESPSTETKEAASDKEPGQSSGKGCRSRIGVGGIAVATAAAVAALMLAESGHTEEKKKARKRKKR